MADAKDKQAVKKDRFRLAIDFVLRKFLIRTDVIKKESEVLEKKINGLKDKHHEGERKNKIIRMQNIISKTNKTYD